jgi:uncharacterized LabA/DUF88 family protein
MQDLPIKKNKDGSSKRKVSIFVDGNNVFFTQKCMGWFFDPKKLLSLLVRNRELVGCFWYTAIQHEEDQRGFRQALVEMGFTIRTKILKQYLRGGEVITKGNLDIEMAIDLLLTREQFDMAILLTGDGDFSSAIKVLQERGIEVLVVSTKKMISKDLRTLCEWLELNDMRNEIEKIK